MYYTHNCQEQLSISAAIGVGYNLGANIMDILIQRSGA